MSTPAAARPWSADLYDRLWTKGRGRWRFGLPQLPDPGGRAPTAEQLRRLRAEWLGLRIDLFDYAGAHRCQRAFAVRRACTLDDLATLICAAFGRKDTEHLYLYEIGERRFAHPALACNDGSATTGATLGEVGLRHGERFFHLYDMGDGWQHSCKVETIPRDTLRALRAHGADRGAAPALQYAARGRSPRQYPRGGDDGGDR
jgi:hypothetical protein